MLSECLEAAAADAAADAAGDADGEEADERRDHRGDGGVADTTEGAGGGDDGDGAARVVLWREATPRLFLGDGGSLTCAHVDMVPQVEVAHGLCGVKVLGIASHERTPELLAQHAPPPEEEDDATEAEAAQAEEALDDDEGGDVDATRVPTDRPLQPHEASLLDDDDVTKLALCEGDLVAFSSGAMHFACNGAGGLSAALYHGLLTRAVVPRLRHRATADAPHQRVGALFGADDVTAGRYANHWTAADLLEELGLHEEQH